MSKSSSPVGFFNKETFMNVSRTQLIVAAAALMLSWAALPRAYADACTAAPHCVDSGAFATDVTQVNGSWDPHHRTYFVRVNFRVRNASMHPLMLGFRWRSSASLVDNFGNTYGIDWKYKDRIIGIGILSNEGADASFILQPGATRTASLVFDRWPGKGSVGDTFNADFSLEQLEPIPGNNSVKTVATHALSFPGLRTGQLIGGVAMPSGDGKAAAVVNGLGSLINSLKKQ
jgi:hypothetical protein